jgi:adenine deaminase
LQAYIAAGIASDHESVLADEALEKLRSGMQVLIREGSTAKNLDGLLPIVNEKTARFCSFATDDKQPDDLRKEGHLDHILRRAIASGLDPVTALQMATINTARHYGLNDMGAVAPGYLADIVTLNDLNNPKVTRTFAAGRLVARDGEMLEPQSNSTPPPVGMLKTEGLNEGSFRIMADGRQVRVIGAIPHQIVTHALVEDVKTEDGQVVPDVERDILKIAVIERHKGTHNVGVGLVHGFGLKAGALASSIAHDSHNIVVIGANDSDMLLAARKVSEMRGGISAARNGELLGQLALPVAGLMSDQPLEVVRESMAQLLEAANSLGCPLENPYMAMAFLALPVIPELKITDMGLVDVTKFALSPLFVGD